MTGPILQIAVLVGMTHVFRALANALGPRHSGLLMGLPTTTALVLVSCGAERGVDEAAIASEACLTGLVAASTLPLAYARAIGAGWNVPRSALAGVLGYLVVALGLWWVPSLGASGCVTVAALGLAGLCRLARRLRLKNKPDSTIAGRPVARVALMLGRTAIPVFYVLLIRTLRQLAGPVGAGRFVTFPGGSLAVLITTHLESGPGTAARMASAMPLGGLGMLAFLTVFRFACPAFGLGWGTAAGYASSIAVIFLIQRLTLHESAAASDRRLVSPLADRWRLLIHWAARVSVRIDTPSPRIGRLARRSVGFPSRRFSPRFEALHA